jgi:hypothetical protein
LLSLSVVTTLPLGAAVQAVERPVNMLKGSLPGGRTDFALNGYDTVA